ncbi:unnamed protein product [Orchesella dallaii]|uniref:DUF4789 domain-containing protein n=1 Tax=Orchesella dallaii TaxID=48710 RepID=A0ABP1QQ02_9HEXA
MANIRKLVSSCKFCLLLLYIVFLCEITQKNNLIAHARFIPASKSFRFPSSLEESGIDLHIPSSSLSDEDSKLGNGKIQFNKLFLASHSRSSSSSSFKTGSSSIPESASPSDDQTISKDKDLINPFYSEDETLSSEVIHADDSDGGSTSNEVELNSPPKDMYQDEDLRNALCSISNLDENGNDTTNNTKTSPPTAPLKLRYDLRAGKCGEVGTSAHCGRNMIFVAEIDSAAYGYCECDFENKIRKREANQIGRTTSTPFVFHLETNACYPLYEQGYCNNGEWLVLSQTEKKAVCEKRTCPTSEKVMKSLPGSRGSQRRSKLLTPEFWTDSSESSPKRNTRSTVNPSENLDTPIWVPLNGKGPCVELNKPSSEYCEEGEQVLFHVGNTVPKCGIPGREIEGRAIIRNACPPGSFYSIIGRCQPDWDF